MSGATCETLNRLGHCPKSDELDRYKILCDGMHKEFHEIEQALGKAMQYPWYKDDQANFPGATESAGVCIGEHTPGTLAMEAADKIERLKKLLQKSLDLVKYAEEMYGCDLDWHSCDLPEPGHVCPHCEFLQQAKKELE